MSNTDFGFSFKADETERTSFEDLPDGVYPVSITEAERKTSKNDPANWYIESKLTVMAGPFADRFHIERYNIGHTKEKVRGFAKSDIANLADAVGYAGNIQSMDPLVGKPFCIVIKNKEQVNKDTGEKSMRAGVVKYLTTSEGMAAAAKNGPAVSAKPTGSFAAPTGIAIAPLTQAAPVQQVAPAVQQAAPVQQAAVPAGAPWG